MWSKKLNIKDDKASKEIGLQQIAANYGFSPKVQSFTEIDDDHIMLHMDKIDGSTLYELYGDDPEYIPEEVWDEIRVMVETLYHDEGIQYIDITPYNFMKSADRLYMIDFGDAEYTNDDGDVNWFLQEFLDGENMWNPDFE